MTLAGIPNAIDGCRAVGFCSALSWKDGYGNSMVLLQVASINIKDHHPLLIWADQKLAAEVTAVQITEE